MNISSLTIAFSLLLASSCGVIAGDPCTTAADCGNRLCLTSGFPGGYCSQSCTLENLRSCPSGTTCVRDALTKDEPACLRTCKSQGECRTGYLCQVYQDSVGTVCSGPVQQ